MQNLKSLLEKSRSLREAAEPTSAVKDRIIEVLVSGLAKMNDDHWSSDLAKDLLWEADSIASKALGGEK